MAAMQLARGAPSARLGSGISQHKIAASQRNAAAANPDRENANGPAREYSDRDPREMEKPGRDHKPNGEGKGIGGAWQFYAVRMAMRDRKDADDCQRGRNRQLPRQS